MSFQNWSKIGAVTYHINPGDIVKFQTLAAFVASPYWKYQNTSRYFAISDELSITEDKNFSIRDRDTVIYTVVHDECGMIIPLWRIKEEAQKQSKKIKKTRIFNARFRSSWNGWRYPKTFNEIKANALFEVERNQYDIHITIRPKRKHLPTVWDDRIRNDHRNRSWKRNRHTQYKID